MSYLSLTHHVDVSDLADAMGGMDDDAMRRFGKELVDSLIHEVGDEPIAALVEGLVNACLDADIAIPNVFQKTQSND